MTKKFIYVFLVIMDGALLWGGIHLYQQWHEPLQSRGVDGVAALLLIVLGIFALLMPVHLFVQWNQLTAVSLIREFVVRGGMVIGLLTAVALIFLLIGWLITLPARLGYRALTLPLLVFLTPLVLTLIDQYRGSFSRTWHNLVVGYGLYSFRIVGMIMIQFAVILTLFALGPAGFFLQLLGLADWVARQGFHTYVSEQPLLCEWANMGDLPCIPLLLLFHVGHLLLVWVVWRYGRFAFNAAVDQYRVGLQSISNRLAK